MRVRLSKFHTVIFFSLLFSGCADTSCRFEDYQSAKIYIENRMNESFSNSNSRVMSREAKWPLEVRVTGDDFARYETRREEALYGSINADIYDANQVLVMRARLYGDCEVEWLQI